MSVQMSPLFEYNKDIVRPNHNGEIGLIIKEKPFFCHLNLKGYTDSLELENYILETLGLKIPKNPNSAIFSEDSCICWLRPNEWLIIQQTQSDLECILRSKIIGAGSLVDVSGGQTIFNLTGPFWRSIISSDSQINIEKNVFTEKHCVQTNLARVPVTMVNTGQTGIDGVDLIIRRSFADYLLNWIFDAAIEFGYSFSVK